MDFSTDQIVDAGVFLLENKEELVQELKESFVKNINQRKDFPTGFYLSTFDTKLSSRMMEHLAKALRTKFGYNTEDSMLMLEENNIKHVIKEIIKESYE